MPGGKSGRWRASVVAVPDQKHIGNIFAKLGPAPDDGGHRRVLAVLAYLDRTASEPQKKANQ